MATAYFKSFDSYALGSVAQRILVHAFAHLHIREIMNRE